MEIGSTPEFLLEHEVLLETVADLEKKIQPEFAKRQTYIDRHSGYTFYAPTYHLHRGLITIEDIASLRAGEQRLLEIGSGPGYLAQVLVDLGVPRGNIVCADQDTSEIPAGFARYQFDYRQPWPSMKEGPFDLILFPSSFPSLDQSSRTIGNILGSACLVLKMNGKIRADRYGGRHIQQLIADNPALNITYDPLNYLLSAEQRTL